MLIKVPVPKGAGFIEVDTKVDVPDAMYTEALLQGLKVMLNKGMTKILTKGLEGDDLTKAQVAAMQVATANFEKLKAGTLSTGRAKSVGDGKVSRELKTEAMRLARNLVKDQLKAAGEKVSHYAAKDITEAANAMLAADESIIEQARESLIARSKINVTVDVASIKADPAKVKAAAEKAAKSKATKDGPLSAAQAGRVAKRKPGSQPTA